MIYLLICFAGAVLFLLGLVIGYVLPPRTLKSSKKKEHKSDIRAIAEPQREIQNFLNYDGSPQP